MMLSVSRTNSTDYAPGLRQPSRSLHRPGTLRTSIAPERLLIGVAPQRAAHAANGQSSSEITSAGRASNSRTSLLTRRPAHQNFAWGYSSISSCFIGAVSKRSALRIGLFARSVFLQSPLFRASAGVSRRPQPCATGGGAARSARRACAMPSSSTAAACARLDRTYRCDFQMARFSAWRSTFCARFDETSVQRARSSVRISLRVLLIAQ